LLLAEDAPDIQRLLRLVLTRAGFEVDAVGDGRQACRLALDSAAQGRPYDLILMDMQMPGLTGLEATAQLRQQGRKGPIVALTGLARPEDRQCCLDAGCNDHLSKPIPHQALLAMVSLHVGDRRQ